MRRFLLITEKHLPNQDFRDGGFRLVQTIKYILGNQVDILQFNAENNDDDYPDDARRYYHCDRFSGRLLNAGFIAEKVKKVITNYSDLIFIHVSMLFGFDENKTGQTIWLFPMFLAPSYVASGEIIPKEYFEKEKQALKLVDKIITPSFLERNQIASLYSIPITKIRVIPRGVNCNQFISVKRNIIHSDSIIFCSLGSIKKQKNTIGLIGIFNQLKTIWPKSILKIIGPVQDWNYLELVRTEIALLGLTSSIYFIGPVDQERISFELKDCHIHLSYSKFETFGRAIFETLSSGIPNICYRKNNASYEFLYQFPFVKYFDSIVEIPNILLDLLENYSLLSRMAAEIGDIFNEERLGNCLKAELTSEDQIIISDFDGTIFHKNDPEKTKSCVTNFNNYKTRVICTSRSPDDILQSVKRLGLSANYIIAYSGSVVTDSEGNALMTLGIDYNDVDRDSYPWISQMKTINLNGQLIQYYTDGELIDTLPAIFREESYQGITFISQWNRTKLRAIQNLLNLIDWQGKVICCGDSRYDFEYLYFYDGYLIANSNLNQNFLNCSEIIPINLDTN